MHQKIAVVHQDPLGVLVALDAEGPLADLNEVFPNGIADRLNLAGVRSVTNDETVGEGSDLAKVENTNV
jgi:hypothetical protein